MQSPTEAKIKLAVAAHSFGQPSETFIRAHVEYIAPGCTVLFCQHDDGVLELGCPVLAELRGFANARGPVERLKNSLRFRWWRYIDPALRGADEARVREFLRRHEVQALLAEFGPNGNLLRVACKRASVPLYVHFHGYDATQLAREASMRRHYRALFRDAAGIIAPSEFLLKRIEGLGCPPSKLHVSPCGIELPEAVHRESSSARFLAVGRLIEKKSPLSTLRAFARVAKRHADAALDLVGKGPLFDACTSEVRRLGIADRVTLHGAISHDEVLSLMNSAFAFVQHSVEAQNGDCEGLPVAILEAMGAGMPVVSTWHSGIPEAVSHGKTGYLVAEHDIEGMAEAMILLLEDRPRAEAMGKAGRARVEAHFTHEKTAARLRQIMGLECCA